MFDLFLSLSLSYLGALREAATGRNRIPHYEGQVSLRQKRLLQLPDDLICPQLSPLQLEDRDPSTRIFFVVGNQKIITARRICCQRRS